MEVRSYSKAAFRYKVRVIVALSACALTACGAEGLPDENTEQAPEIGAAVESIPESNTSDPDGETQVNVSFTTENSTDEAIKPNTLVTESSVSASIDVDASVAEASTIAAVSETTTSEPTVPKIPAAETPGTDTTVTALPSSGPENAAPHIDDTSYNCDPITEAVLFTIGDIDTFTLSVTDETPLQLEYDVDTSSSETTRVTVDENGVFTITALAAGESFVWLAVSDDEGLLDEYELHVIVQ